jgi:hypothetical protein
MSAGRQERHTTFGEASAPKNRGTGATMRGAPAPVAVDLCTPWYALPAPSRWATT